jgi:threonine/homoserine/homoserine lactone efflux protein
MHQFQLLLRGAAAGLAISASVGPVNVLCISRTITKGKLGGIVSGLGAAAADTIYGSVAGFSISFVISWLLRELFWIRLVGGMVLLGIASLYYFKKPPSLKEAEARPSAGSDFATTFLLNLTNPTTVLSFIAVLAVLGLGERRPWTDTIFLVAGIFAGAMFWWIVLALIVGHYRDRFDDRAVLRLNHIGALAIGGFGLVTIGLALK